MFLINTIPLGIHKTFEDYAQFLLKRHIIPQFWKGITELHVLFDTPGRLTSTPKHFEQRRRDKVAKISDQHYCNDIGTVTNIPTGKWHANILNCRQCKRNLVIFLGRYFLAHAKDSLKNEKKLYVAGAFDGDGIDTAWFVKGPSEPQPDPEYFCVAEETDTRIWLHVKQSSSNNILILSPDTDVYHIGCGLQIEQSKCTVIQLSKMNSKEIKLLNLQNLTRALRTDPDLAQINEAILPNILQTLYVCTGCDYTSFFSRIGKATFLKYFFQYATFINPRSRRAQRVTVVRLSVCLFVCNI